MKKSNKINVSVCWLVAIVDIILTLVLLDDNRVERQVPNKWVLTRRGRASVIAAPVVEVVLMKTKKMMMMMMMSMMMEGLSLLVCLIGGLTE